MSEDTIQKNSDLRLSILETFFEEFNKESDRSCVILSAAVLDSALKTLFVTKLVPITSNQDTFLDGPYSPISSFSSRIELAFRIGLISSRLARDLNLIRKIRNDFAHNITDCSFENSGVQNRLSELCNSFGMRELSEGRMKAFGDSPRGRFQLIVGSIQFYLHGITSDIQSFETPEEELPYRYVWSEDPKTPE